jgi:putative transposase
VVTDLITGLRERGLDVTRPILAVLDGAKALSRAVNDVFDKPLIQRCQQHKIKMLGTSCPNSCGRSPSGGCARPTTPNRR